IRHLIHVIVGTVHSIPAGGGDEIHAIFGSESSKLSQHLKQVRRLDVLENFETRKPISWATSNVFQSKVTDIRVFPGTDGELTTSKDLERLIGYGPNIHA